jgi:hypothetical protein
VQSTLGVRGFGRIICFGLVIIAVRQGQRRNAAATGEKQLGRCTAGLCIHIELELKLIQIQMEQKPMLRLEVYARALRASQNAKRAKVWLYLR